MSDQHTGDAGPIRQGGSEDIVVIRTATTGEPSELPARAARRLGRLPQHATAPVTTVDADRRSSRRRSSSASGGRRARLVVGIVLIGGGGYAALTAAGII